MNRKRQALTRTDGTDEIRGASESGIRCPTCGEPAALQVEDEVTASLHCASGHRTYFYKRDNGRWESQAARRNRMNKYRVCEQKGCGKEYMLSHLPSLYWAERFPGMCPSCITPLIKQYYVRGPVAQGNGKNNPNSPWRKWMNRKSSAA